MTAVFVLMNNRTAVVHDKELIMEGLEYLSSLSQWKGQGGFSLEPMKILMGELGNPQDSYKTIHVAGTNGKGSVSVMFASVFGSAGYKVGLTTSPHLIKQNERIVIDGLPISDDHLNRYAAQVMLAAKKKAVVLSYFEAITAISFIAFANENVDWAIVEVGLGGRLDATNVIKHPEACIVVSIGLDHVSILGNTVEEITREKAGILKPDSMAVIGRLNDSCCYEAKKAANTINVNKFMVLGQDFDYGLRDLVDDTRHILISMHDDDLGIVLEPGLLGSHQIDNAAIVAQTCKNLGIPKIAIEDGIRQARWPGRLQWISIHDRKILIDCAHNGAGASALSHYLKSGNIKGLSCIFGVLERQDWKDMILSLQPFISEWYLLEPPSDRKISSRVVQEFIKTLNVNAVIINDINGLDDVLEDSTSDLLFTGSIYLIGEVVQHFEKESNYRLPGMECLWIRRPLN